MEDSDGICPTLAAPHARQGGSRWSSDECNWSSLCLYLGSLACRFCPFEAGHFCMPTCFRMDMNFGSDQGLPTDVLSRFGWSVAPPQARTGPKLGKSIMVYLRRAPSAASDTVPSRSFTPAQRGSPAKHAPGATSVCVVMPNRPIDFAPPGPSQQAFVSFTVTDHLLRLNRL